MFGTPLAPSRSAASDRLTRRGVNQPAAATRSRPDGKRRRDGARARSPSRRRGLVDARWSLALRKCRSEPRAATRGSDESVAGHRQTARALAFAYLTPPSSLLSTSFGGRKTAIRSGQANGKYDYIGWGVGMAVPDKAIGSVCAGLEVPVLRTPKTVGHLLQPSSSSSSSLSLFVTNLSLAKSQSLLPPATRGSKVLDDMKQLRHDPRSRTRAERPRRRGCCATVLH